MSERFDVVFDESATASGPYYLLNDVVLHGAHGLVCRVTDVQRIRASRMRAFLEVVDNPTDDEEARAQTWQRRSLGLKD
jgi:hypothetical protein